ncbi:tRNA wybutosine-synthesizing protein 4 isoform 2-T3 [Discoglossus pictus]
MKSSKCSTNDCSTVSKVSAAHSGYFMDNFQKYFINRKCRRSPLIHRGYHIRSQAVSFCLRKFIQDTKDCDNKQIISLGCGFDSLYFRLQAEASTPVELCVWEVDFLTVVQRKCHLIQQTEALRISLGPCEIIPPDGPMVLSTPNYKLLGVDLNDVSSLDRALEGAGLRWDCPSLILGEVALCYMDPARSTALIAWASSRFSSARFVLYEQISPTDPFGQVMMNHFISLNSPLLSVATYPQLQDQEQRFLQQGWEQFQALDINEFSMTCVPVLENLRVQALEPFDEFEEYHLKCSHYFILVASSGALTDRAALPRISPGNADFHVSPPPMTQGCLSVFHLPVALGGLRRFGHRSCSISSQVIITTGGFGAEDAKHQRLTDVHILLREGECSVREERASTWDGRLLHSLTPLSEGGRVLALGGRFSPTTPAPGVFILKYEEESSKVTVKKKDLEPDLLRWRHSATEVSLNGQSYILVFGGRSLSSLALQDTMFLHPHDLHWVQVPVLGSSPSGRHSHNSCKWKDGAVISGGLLASGVPSGSITLIKPCGSHFKWERLRTTPSLTPRYSHSSHVMGDKLLLVGGVWIHCRSVPGVAIIDLNTGHVAEYEINTSSLEWPLMMHGHSSVLLPEEMQVLIMGGGGNCFSFGTHLNKQPILLQLPPGM